VEGESFPYIMLQERVSQNYPRKFPAFSNYFSQIHTIYSGGSEG
jgi:hypothetical protein